MHGHLIGKLGCEVLANLDRALRASRTEDSIQTAKS